MQNSSRGCGRGCARGLFSADDHLLGSIYEWRPYEKFWESLD
ncbi:hypothetical protein [Turicimonas muris]